MGRLLCHLFIYVVLIMETPYIGTAAWTIPKNAAGGFGPEGSHLARYSQVLNAVELNSSFYREHQAKTYARWAQETPENFRFSVKLAKAFTHECGLKPDEGELLGSLENILHLGEKLGVLLVQLPPKQLFDRKLMERFYRLLREKISVPIVIEPRNQGWFSEESRRLWEKYQISKVIADPEKCQGQAINGLSYFRLHGSPLIYKSAYTPEYLQNLMNDMRSHERPWCIFDNTTFGYATENALSLTDAFHGTKGAHAS